VYEELTRSRGRRQFPVNCCIVFYGRFDENSTGCQSFSVFSLKVSARDVIVTWKRINFRVVEPDVSDKFSTMLTNVGKYVKLRRNKYRFEYRKQFCYRQWLSLSVFAATNVAIAALIQTYAAVVGSNGMKTHFPPQHFSKVNTGCQVTMMCLF